MIEELAGKWTRVSRIIPARREDVYQAFLDPHALEQWLPPGDMTGAIQSFKEKEGYRMSLIYPEGDKKGHGKTKEGEDTFFVKFVDIGYPTSLDQSVQFVSSDPSMTGEMKMRVTFELEEPLKGEPTKVTIECTNIPAGINREDNEEGCRQSLEKLEKYLAKKKGQSA
jgi:uncharacterized protein YndB with AHSA1/START domain